MPTHYEVLGVSESASQSLIRSTYLRLLQIYHPDHNADPIAGKKTAEIIEAYSVLSDPDKRAQYNEALHANRNTKSSGRNTQSPPPSPQKTPVAQVICEKCGVQNSSLRISLMYWVASALVLTRRGGKAGIWCERCRAKQAAIWSFISGAVGWWGVPWGPIYTVQALYFNALGGQQDKVQNAALLRLVGFQLYEKGNAGEALIAIEASLSLENDDATATFSNILRNLSESKTKRRYPFFKAITAAPSATVALIIVLWIVHIINEPTGYAARSRTPKHQSRTTGPHVAIGTIRPRRGQCVS